MHGRSNLTKQQLRKMTKLSCNDDVSISCAYPPACLPACLTIDAIAFPTVPAQCPEPYPRPKKKKNWVSDSQSNQSWVQTQTRSLPDNQ